MGMQRESVNHGTLVIETLMHCDHKCFAIMKSLQAEDTEGRKKETQKGRARDRTGIAGIRIQSDNHYTTQPYLLKDAIIFCYIDTIYSKLLPELGTQQPQDSMIIYIPSDHTDIYSNATSLPIPHHS